MSQRFLGKLWPSSDDPATPSTRVVHEAAVTGWFIGRRHDGGQGLIGAAAAAVFVEVHDTRLYRGRYCSQQ